MFHGSDQQKSKVGRAFVEDTGYLEWAATNKIVLLFPQAIELETDHYIGRNPPTCFDCYGTSSHPFDGSDDPFRYTTNQGLQPRAFKAMVDRILGNDKW